MPIQIETERLVLRNYCDQDLENVYSLKSDPLVWKYSTRVTSNKMEDSRDYLATILKNYTEGKQDFQALSIKETMEYIGEAGILSFNKENKKAVIGYNLLSKHWGKGFATEITRAMVKHLFEVEKVERIEALVMEGNIASKKVLEKSGFQVEGLLRNFTCIEDRYYHVYFFGIIKSDYFK